MSDELLRLPHLQGPAKKRENYRDGWFPRVSVEMFQMRFYLQVPELLESCLADPIAVSAGKNESTLLLSTSLLLCFSEAHFRLISWGADLSIHLGQFSLYFFLCCLVSFGQPGRLMAGIDKAVQMDQSICKALSLKQRFPKDFLASRSMLSANILE